MRPRTFALIDPENGNTMTRNSPSLFSFGAHPRIGLVLPATILLLAAACGCGDRADASNARADASAAAPRAVRLVGGYESPSALITEALDAFAAADTTRLERLLITRNEFDSLLYPELGMHYPAANDMRPETRAFLWENQALNSIQGLKHALRDMSGRRSTLLGITYRGGGHAYRSYKIHEGTLVRLRMDDGREALSHAFGSIVEMDGRYKLLTFRERD